MASSHSGRRLRAEAQVVVVLGEARELEDHQPLAQAPLEGEARLGAELKAGARDEQVAQQAELVRLEDDGVSKRGRAAHYAPSPELPLALSGSPQSDAVAASASGRMLAAVVMAARTIWSFSRS